MHQIMLAQPNLQGDETPCQVLREPGKSASSKSYIWVIRSVRDAKQPVVYYAYGNSRSGTFAQRIYSGYTGTLQCDGYSGYNALGDAVNRVGCWVHVRRKFFNAAQQGGGNLKPSKGLELIDQMFHLEHEWRDFSAEERQTKRDCELRPVMTKFWQWCDKAVETPKSALGRALTYARNQRQELIKVLEHGTIDLSNNASERSVKQYVIGRKNWLFSTIPDGATANAIWLSLIESAKANGLDPREYIEFVLEGMSQLSEAPSPEQLAAYLPWNCEQSQQHEFEKIV